VVSLITWFGRKSAASLRTGGVHRARGSLMPAVALVVDDSMLIRYTVCRSLEERGFTVESATNGVEALQILERLRPDLIVTDMLMPKMSGSELITALKKNPATANIPVIIVAGRGSGFDENEKRADFAIYKDIDIQCQLGKALDAVLGKGRGQSAGK
jgi:CheY-like chemotaxis protein